jgi:hypothetical protein
MPAKIKYESRILEYTDPVDCQKEWLAFRKLLDQVGEAVRAVSPQRRLAQFEYYFKNDFYIILGNN